jgi:hypothetical protein
MTRALIIFVLVMSSVTLTGNVLAEESVEMQGTTIIGNRELPKVLYIMPWKKAEPGDLVEQPINSIFDEVIEPVDREVFRRKLDYFKLFEKKK